MVRFFCGVVAFVVSSIVVSVLLDPTSEGLIVLFAWMLGAAVGVGVYTVLRTGLEAPPARSTTGPTG